MSLIRLELVPSAADAASPIFLRPSEVNCIAPSREGAHAAVVTLKNGRWHTVRGTAEEVHALLFGTAEEFVSKTKIREALEREYYASLESDRPIEYLNGLRTGILGVATRIMVPYDTSYGPQKAAALLASCAGTAGASS